MTLQRPLYNEASSEPRDREPHGHAGLWFDKFCNTWCNDWTMKAQQSQRNQESPKLKWIHSLTGSKVGKKEDLEESAQRLMRLLKRRSGRAEVFTSTYRFVTGLGRSHPVENGFTWHPVLGTPYLPGSSIKGLVRSWAREKTSDEETGRRLFGSHNNAGNICFLDAIPIAPVQLEADVMTPHYAGWSKTEPPGDWRSPTPIPFLVMAKETSLLFGIIPCGPVKNGDIDHVLLWLKEALAQAGGGAKTAVGYGRFDLNKEETDRWNDRLKNKDDQRHREQERVEAQKTPEGRWRFKLKEKSEEELRQYVTNHLITESTRLNDPTERQAFISALFSFPCYEKYIENWKNGKRYDGKKLKKPAKKKLKELGETLEKEREGRMHRVDFKAEARSPG